MLILNILNGTAVIAVIGLTLSQFAIASVLLTSKITLDYELTITSKDVQSSRYIPEPLSTIVANENDQFSVVSVYPTVMTVVDLEYTYGTQSYNPRCHFRFVIVKDYRSGNMLPQNIIAESENGSCRDKALCSGKIDSFDFNTGNSKITLSVDRRKY